MANRGPYKRYEEHGSQHSVPRQTLHRRRVQERQRNENIGIVNLDDPFITPKIFIHQSPFIHSSFVHNLAWFFVEYSMIKSIEMLANHHQKVYIIIFIDNFMIIY